MDKKMTADVKIASSVGASKLKGLKNQKGIFRWIVIFVIVILIILAGLWVVSETTSLNILGISKDSGEWQAVFLDNGQVYFGKTCRENNETVLLKDIYYLQVTKGLQPAEGATNQSEVSLVKLGNELHGPEDEMRINRDHILFIEDLKPEGKVVLAIESYLETEE